MFSGFEDADSLDAPQQLQTTATFFLYILCEVSSLQPTLHSSTGGKDEDVIWEEG